jgi:hypothetical protein
MTTMQLTPWRDAACQANWRVTGTRHQGTSADVIAGVQVRGAAA